MNDGRTIGYILIMLTSLPIQYISHINNTRTKRRTQVYTTEVKKINNIITVYNKL